MKFRRMIRVKQNVLALHPGVELPAIAIVSGSQAELCRLAVASKEIPQSQRSDQTVVRPGDVAGCAMKGWQQVRGGR